jgi:2-dehydro-3-deoxy-D-arabinonate dehydratase
VNEGSADLPRALCRFYVPGAGARLGGVYAGRVVDLTAREPALCASLAALLSAPPGTLDDVLERYAGAAPDFDYAALDRAPVPDAAHLLAPIDAQEVWAAGVTYTRSREARMEESQASADVYARVYDAARPELFFKATAARVAGPNAAVVARADAAWTVPEPELTLLLDERLAIVGYTIGDDLTARDIEGQNPLYQPQAKVYDRGCALGPFVVPAGALDPYALAIRCEIWRQGRALFEGTTSTAMLHRRLDDLVAYLGRHNQFPAGAYLMTGTGIVPPDDVALRSGDEIVITIQGLGTLRNVVH